LFNSYHNGALVSTHLVCLVAQSRNTEYNRPFQ